MLGIFLTFAALFALVLQMIWWLHAGVWPGLALIDLVGGWVTHWHWYWQPDTWHGLHEILYWYIEKLPLPAALVLTGLVEARLEFFLWRRLLPDRLVRESQRTSEEDKRSGELHGAPLGIGREAGNQGSLD